jgi:hypothetical protein
MGPAIVVVTTINFDSLPQPQDSPFSRDGSDSPEDFPWCTFVSLVVNGSGFHWTTTTREIIRIPDAAYNL